MKGIEMTAFIRRVFVWIVEKYLYWKIKRRLALESLTAKEITILKSVADTLK